MIGLFDSGMGGHNTLRHLRSLYPDENIVLLTDRKNSPFGTKSEEELIEIIKQNIITLDGFGIRKILIGCCTASGVFDRNCHKMGLTCNKAEGIIEPVIREARAWSQNGRVAVIATEASICSHTFATHSSHLQISEFMTQPLVAMIDGGLTDENIKEGDKEKIEVLLSPLKECEADVLILGCTHFGSLKKNISDIVRPYGILKVIDSARSGARGFRRHLTPLCEEAMTYYLDT